MIVSQALLTRDLRDAVEQGPSYSDSGGGSLSARLPARAVGSSSPHIWKLHASGKNSGLAGGGVGFRVPGFQAVGMWVTLLTFLNFNFLIFKKVLVRWLSSELTVWCHCSASHSPVASHVIGRKLQSPCTVCPALHSSSDLIPHPESVPHLVFQTHQAHSHLRAFALAVCIS